VTRPLAAQVRHSFASGTRCARIVGSAQGVFASALEQRPAAPSIAGVGLAAAPLTSVVPFLLLRGSRDHLEYRNSIPASVGQLRNSGGYA
jgi:hypothetical protein